MHSWKIYDHKHTQNSFFFMEEFSNFLVKYGLRGPRAIIFVCVRRMTEINHKNIQKKKN